MAATSPRSGGCGGYSSCVPGSRRAALLHGSGSSAVFRQTSPTPRAVSPPRRARGFAPAPPRPAVTCWAGQPRRRAPLPAARPQPLPRAAPSSRRGRLPAPTRGRRPLPPAPGRCALLGSPRVLPGSGFPGPTGLRFFSFECLAPPPPPPSSPGLNPRGWIPGGVGRAALEARDTPRGAAGGRGVRGRSHCAPRLWGNEYKFLSCYWGPGTPSAWHSAGAQ